jgi:hypothetical protein
MKRIMTALAVAAMLASVPMFAASGTALAASTTPIYNSIPSSLPGNLPSLGFEATSTSEFGNQIVFGGSARTLDNVVVTLSSWACQSGSGITCSTTLGATFPVPITLNIYNPPTTGSYPAPGTLIATDTQTFSIPYRPTADPNCANGGWDAPNCFNGYANNITFNAFTPAVVTLPNNIVYGIAFNTSAHGYAPTGCTGSCPYDSLNVALSLSPPEPTVGTDPNTGTVFWNTSVPGFYCDGGAAGSGFFRLDSPGFACWGTTPPCDASGCYGPPYYIPAVQFNAILTGPPTSKDQCKDGGWMAFNNPSFKNQGDCVSFVATHGKNGGNG